MKPCTVVGPAKAHSKAVQTSWVPRIFIDSITSEFQDNTSSAKQTDTEKQLQMMDTPKSTRPHRRTKAEALSRFATQNDQVSI